MCSGFLEMLSICQIKLSKMSFLLSGVRKIPPLHTHTLGLTLPLLLADGPKLAENAPGTARSFKKSRLKLLLLQVATCS